MNSWGNEQYAQNMMGMPPGMMPSGPLQPPPSVLFGAMGDMNMNQTGLGNSPANFIVPIVPDTDDDNVVVMEDVQNGTDTVRKDEAQDSHLNNPNKDSKERSRSDRSERHDRGYERDNRRRRSRSRNRDRDHSKDYHNNRRNRPSKWNKDDNVQLPNKTMMMPGQAMPPGQPMQGGPMQRGVMPPMQGGAMQGGPMPSMQGGPMQPMQGGPMPPMQGGPMPHMHGGPITPMQGSSMPPLHPGQQMFPGQMQMFNPMMNMHNQMGNMSNQMGNMQHPMANMGMDMSNMMMGNMGMNMLMMNPNMQMDQNDMYFSGGCILPPLPGTTTPARRDKPKGCRTIFIGGLPNGITQEAITEIFQRFGDIDDVKVHRQGVWHIRFERPESVEESFLLSGSRIKLNDQNESDLVALFVDYALNREDQNEFEKNQRKRAPSPPRVEQFTPTAFAEVGDKIKTDAEFSGVAHTLAVWLERGECNKKNANSFYHMIQASNNQLRRLFNEKMSLDDEFNTMRNTYKDKFSHVLLQFEQVAKILKAAKHQRVSDHFSKQQRRNIEMWLKMTEEVENIKEEFTATFDEEETEKCGKNVVPLAKYEQLRAENDSLLYELEGYKNEAHLAKDEAERKFEKFKAHFVAQQALQNKTAYPPLPAPPVPTMPENISTRTPAPVNSSEAKLISLVSAFLMIHPLGASLDYIVSYVKSMVPNVTQSAVHEILKKYTDVFKLKTTGVGAFIDHKWSFAIFDTVKQE